MQTVNSIFKVSFLTISLIAGIDLLYGAELLPSITREAKNAFYNDAQENRADAVRAFLAPLPKEFVFTLLSMNRPGNFGAVAYWGCADVLKEYLAALPEERKTDLVTASNIYGETALHWAALHGHEKIAAMLISALPENRKFGFIKAVNLEGQTALHWAAESGRALVVPVLLEALSDPQKAELIKIEDKKRETAVLAAVRYERLSVVRILIEYWKRLGMK